MRALRILIRIILAICLLLFVAGLVINLFDLFTFRRPDHKILANLQELEGYSVSIDSIAYADGSLSFAGVRDPARERHTAMFFVHGSPGGLDACMPYLTDTRLAAKADLYAYDRPGFGQTVPRRPESSLVKQSAALHALVTAAGARRNILVGHSLGCPIIARFAMDHPELADGLIMVAAAVDPALEPPNWWRYVLDFPLIRIGMPWPFANSNAELIPLKDELEACLPLWDRIDCPVLWVHGAHDQLVPVENVHFGASILAPHVEQRTHILRDEGHFIFWTHADEIVNAMIPLLD